MSARALKALAGVVAGLFIIWIAVTFLPRGGGDAEGASEALPSFFEGVDPESVAAVGFIGPDSEDSIRLERRDGLWRVNGYAADSGLVSRFWDALEEARVGDLVASNPANHPRMGVAADSAWTFLVNMPSGARSLLVGKPGSRYGTAYVRLPGEDGVHALEGNLRPHLTRSLNDWRSKRVAALDTALVGEIQVQGEEGDFSLRRLDSIWASGAGIPADSGRVRSMLGELARLDASGFYETSDTLPPLGTVLRALGEAGDTLLTLEVGAGEGDRWLREMGDSILYRIPSWRVTRLIPPPEDVFPSEGL